MPGQDNRAGIGQLRDVAGEPKTGPVVGHDGDIVTEGQRQGIDAGVSQAMGSVAGALVGSVLIGLVRSFGTIGFPLFTEGLMFLLMAVVLVLKPSGLFGKGGR